MAFVKGQPKIKGRTKGALNKTTVKAKEAFQMAFDQLGGVEAMAKWAKADPDNLKVFYGLYSKLIPTDLTTNGKDVGPATITIVREIMAARPEGE